MLYVLSFYNRFFIFTVYPANYKCFLTKQVESSGNIITNMKQSLFALFFVMVWGKYLWNECYFPLTETFSPASALRIVSHRSSFPFLPSSGAFPEEAEIGVFIFPASSKDTPIHSYPIRQVKARALPAKGQAIEWKCMPAVSLPSESVMLYAYHPYQPSASIHPHAIPIKVSTDAGNTPDYRYGALTSGHKKVTAGSSLALIAWKPALPVLSFEIYDGRNTTAPAYLKAIQIRNKAGASAFCQRGFLNAISGEITPVFTAPGATSRLLPTPIPLRTTESSRHEFRVMPLDTLRNAEEIEIVFSIDNRTYTYAVPARTSWRKGYRYLYRFVFTGEEICLQTTGIQPFF